MAAIQVDVRRALDEAGPENAAMIIALTLEDSHQFAAEQAAAGNYHALDAVIAREEWEKEVRMYRGFHGLAILEEPDLVDEIAVTIQADTEAKAKAEHRPMLFQCAACNGHFNADDCYQVNCEHYYCDGCLAELFRGATTDESLYPPRCCGDTIPYEDISIFLPKELREHFEGKREELDDTNRLYCRVPTCSAYIGVGLRFGDAGTCVKCDAKTCVHCKNAAHAGDCAQDQATQDTLKLATEEGWKKCPKCERMIELTFGCNHMICFCRAQFCYVCRAPWKTCLCPQWDPNRLLARAQRVADREHGGPAGAEQVQAAAVILRQRHQCDHRPRHEWDKIDGEHRCEECADTLRRFIFRCPQCRLQACMRCKNNRL
ncbi:hypothetical protein LTR85_002597 [Meristemomyces frigidus]|nr:hypothetical protein LTR85_002597 [Meristemomyces frigidus]